MPAKEYYDVRKDTVSGIIEMSDLFNVNCHFSEWWNGEGVDFTFTEGDKEETVRLDMAKFHCIVAVASYLGMVSKEDIRDTVGKLRGSWDDRLFNNEVINGY